MHLVTYWHMKIRGFSCPLCLVPEAGQNLSGLPTATGVQCKRLKKALTSLLLIHSTQLVIQNLVRFWKYLLMSISVLLSFSRVIITVNAQPRQPNFSQIWVLELLLDLASTHKWFPCMNGTMLLTVSVVTLPCSHCAGLLWKTGLTLPQTRIVFLCTVLPLICSPFHFPICRCSFCKELERRISTSRL